MKKYSMKKYSITNLFYGNHVKQSVMFCKVTIVAIMKNRYCGNFEMSSLWQPFLKILPVMKKMLNLQTKFPSFFKHAN